MKFLTQLLHLFNSSKKKKEIQCDQPRKEKTKELTKLGEDNSQPPGKHYKEQESLWKQHVRMGYLNGEQGEQPATTWWQKCCTAR